MLEQKKKIAKMVDELFKFFVSKNAKKIDINYTEDNTQYIITAKSKLAIEEEEMIYIHSNFVKHRDLEYETYWDLMGEISDEDELYLLFNIADDVRIYYEDEILKFIIELNK